MNTDYRKNFNAAPSNRPLRLSVLGAERLFNADRVARYRGAIVSLTRPSVVTYEAVPGAFNFISKEPSKDTEQRDTSYGKLPSCKHFERLRSLRKLPSTEIVPSRPESFKRQIITAPKSRPIPTFANLWFEGV